MTNQEFSDQFDVLYNSITSNQAPGLDEYEKSVFLTKAQDEILKSYFDPALNKPQEGFDGSQRRQIDFSTIVKVATPSLSTGGNYVPHTNAYHVTMPNDILMIINERAKVTRDGTTVFLTVVALQYGEFDRLMSKPFKRPVKYQAWRIMSLDGTMLNSDLVAAPGDTFTEYAVRYVKRPKPIVLFNLDGLTINGVGTATDCELDPILHQEILQRAVELAKAAYTGDLQSQVALGSTSQTNIGAVQQSR